MPTKVPTLPKVDKVNQLPLYTTIIKKLDRLEDEFFRLKSLLAFKSNHWRHIYESKCGSLYIYQNENGQVCVQMSLPVNSKVASEAIFNSKWEDLFSNMTITRDDWVEEEGIREIHVETRSHWPIAGRDCFLLERQRQLKDGSYLSLATSIDSAPPTTDGSVRMTIPIFGMLITPVHLKHDSFVETSEFYGIFECDPHGFIPTSLKEQLLMTTLPKSFLRLRTSLEGMTIILPMMRPPPHPPIDKEQPLRMIERLEEISNRLDDIEAKLEKPLETGQPSWSEIIIRVTPWILTTSLTIYFLYLKMNPHQKDLKFNKMY